MWFRMLPPSYLKLPDRSEELEALQGIQRGLADGKPVR
jgi:hypothetical protein